MIPPNSDFNPATPPILEPMSALQSFTKALFSPSEETFQRIGYAENASFWRPTLWLFLAVLLGTVILMPLSLVFQSEQLDLLRETFGAQADALVGTLGLMACLVPLISVMAVIGSIIGVAIYQAIARLLGGAGDFNALYNAYAAFAAPIMGISYALSAIPIAGACISGLLGLYNLVLTVIAIQAVNRFGYGKAILTLLIPTIVFVSCCCLFYILLFSTLMASFPELQQLVPSLVP